jgi:hypothetical protein
MALNAITTGISLKRYKWGINLFYNEKHLVNLHLENFLLSIIFSLCKNYVCTGLYSMGTAGVLWYIQYHTVMGAA